MPTNRFATRSDEQIIRSFNLAIEYRDSLVEKRRDNPSAFRQQRDLNEITQEILLWDSVLRERGINPDSV